ncbi:uncharacterized protein LOC135127740 isoform X2 [Zophobas morio]|uniref:uncharacterized protein LOC135127740 isoform X2 n=1 Tax=Zophobas morio TaxID=2755281 RepID=UPI0030832B98
MNDLDLEDLESMLYSQVYHGVNDETEPHENLRETLSKPTDDMRRPGRYFGPWSPGSRLHKNAPQKSGSKTPGRRDNRQEGSYNKSFGKARKPEISINQVLVVSPKPIMCMTAKERSRARRKLKMKEKIKQKKALKALNVAKSVKQVEQDVITVSDSEDDSCVIVDNKWPVLSVADSDDEKETVREDNVTQSSNIDNTENTEVETLNESLTDDVIFIEPVVAPIEVINLDEELDVSKEKHSETASSASSDNTSINDSPTKNLTQQMHQERKELLRTPDSASNDFMNNSGVELNQNNFNFSLHGSDFNNDAFLKPAPPTETCETESSSSTTDANSVNLMKTIVFNEVDFPKEDIFSENNLESFGNFITPLRTSATMSSVQSSPLRLPDPQNKTIYSSDSSSESDYEEAQIDKKDVAQKAKLLPELSPMQLKQSASLSIVKKTKKTSGLDSKYDLISGTESPVKDIKAKNSCKKKKKNKKRKSGNDESFEKEMVTEEVEDELKRKKRKSSQMENSELGENNQPKKRNVSINSNDVTQEATPDDELTPVDVSDPAGTGNNADVNEFIKSDSFQIVENIETELTPSVVSRDETKNDSVLITTEDHTTPPINNISLIVKDDKPNESSDLQLVEIKEEETESPPAPLDGVVVVEEVFTETNTLVELSDAESVLSSLQEQPDIQLNFEEPKSDDKVCLTVEFGMDLTKYSVKELQLKMSNDPKLWTILDSDRSPSRKNRGRRCTRCKQFGHVGIRCTNRVEPKCTLCGGRGHYEPRCPNKLCTQCGQRSPYATTYCNSCFKFRNFRCQICSMPGHLPDACPDLWRRYHLTTSEGPLIKQTGPSLKEKNQLWCSGCARSGHLEHSCRFYKSIYPPTDVDIKSYEDIYKEETKQQKPLRFSPPSNHHMNNQVYQPRPAFRGNYAQTSHNYNQVNPQFIKPFMDGIFVANQQNFFPPEPPNLLQYPPNHNHVVFNNVLPTFISFDSQVPAPSAYEPVPELKSGSRYFKTKRNGKVANSMFFNSTAIQLQQFVSEELRRLTKVGVMSHKLVQEVRKRRIPDDYEMLNMLLFGVFNLKEGKGHLEKLKQFSWTKKSRVDNGTRRRLLVSYCYIFGRDCHPDVDYNELLRVV